MIVTKYNLIVKWTLDGGYIYRIVAFYEDGTPIYRDALSDISDKADFDKIADIIEKHIKDIEKEKEDETIKIKSAAPLTLVERINAWGERTNQAAADWWKGLWNK